VLTALLKAVDALPFVLPTPLVPPLFFFLSLRSRIFSFIPARRPDRGEQDGAPTPREVIRPSWTPPGIAFPFIWLTISCLRAASSTLIWKACGKTLACPAILVLIAHLWCVHLTHVPRTHHTPQGPSPSPAPLTALGHPATPIAPHRHPTTPPPLTPHASPLARSVGDTWNAVTNVERRLGTSAVGVLVVLASVYAAVATYYMTIPLAGLLLAPSACWISIASVLTWTIWKINTPNEPLLPQVGDGKSAPLRLPLSAPLEN
jgi:tryptophan-rich sensory protein